MNSDLVSRIRAEVAEELTTRARAAASAGEAPLGAVDQELLGRQLVNEALDRHARRCLADGRPVPGQGEEEAVAQAVLDRLFARGRLQRLLEDTSLENINANGCDVVFLEDANGNKVPGPPLADSDEEFIELIRELARREGLSERLFDPAHPILDLPLSDGSRLSATAWICPRPCVSVRLHRHPKIDLDDLVGLGTIDRCLREFFGAAVRGRFQILVAGETKSGKTTMLRALAADIPPGERIITIETELELGLDRFPELHPDCVAYEARPANVEGVGEITAADLVRASLRMNPDRVLVGEVRGAETGPMLNAMSQGNEGSLCSLHADSAESVFPRLAAYALQAPERTPIEATNRIAAHAIDLVVFMARRGPQRFVSAVHEVSHCDGELGVVTNEVFQPGPDGRAVPRPGMPISHRRAERLAAHGFDLSLLTQLEGWWE
ncbi:MAG: ATPase, T2SS/T4P/T4SS family [Actinomycetota bacterium]